MITTVVFDLDGVIRHFPASDVTELESRHQLKAGILHRVAFAPPLLNQVTTGKITRDEWIQKVGEQLGNSAAASEWSLLPSVVDPSVLRLADELSAAGLTTAVLTNGTDTVATELAAAGIDQHFDEIFNSADIGYAKPDVRVFEYVLRSLNRAATEVFFTDDSASKIAGARTLGMVTHLYRGIPELRSALRQCEIGIEAH